MEFSPVEKPFSARTFRRKALFRTGTEGERAFPRFSGDGTSAVNKELSGRTAFPL